MHTDLVVRANDCLLPNNSDQTHTLRQLGRRGVRLAGGGDGDAGRRRGSGGRGPGTVLIACYLLSVVRRVLPELLRVNQL